MARDNTCTLFFKHFDNGLGATGRNGVKEDERNGGNQTKHGRDQRLRNATGHHFRVAGAEQGDRLEGLDHPRNGA